MPCRLEWFPLMCIVWQVSTLVCAGAGTLEDQLRSEPIEYLIRAVREQGDAARGAIVFHQPHVACTKCHAVVDRENPLGPDLTRLPPDVNDAHLVESVLEPSKLIRQGYEAVSVITAEGRNLTGILVRDEPNTLVLREVDSGKLLTLSKDEIDAYSLQTTSAMPVGQAAQLTSRQEFLDLIRYLIEIRDGGPQRVRRFSRPHRPTR